MEPVRSLREHLLRLREAGELRELGQAGLGDVPSLIAESGGMAGMVSVRGYAAPFAFNTMSSRRHAALALGIEEEDLRSRFLEAAAKPRAPESLGDLGMRGPMEPDLEALPIPKYYERDAGRYITSAIVFARDPDGGTMNASFHRIRVLDGRRGVIRMVENRHLHRIYMSARERGEDLKIAVEIGANPIVELAAAYQAPFGSYEAWIANAMAGGSLRFSDFAGVDVPLETEVLLEGRIRHDAEGEDAMVDMLGLYDRPRMQPVVEFDRMYVSEGFVFRGLLAGGPEHRFLMSFPIEVKLERQLGDVLPGVRRVVLTEGGGRWLHAVIQIEKRLESDPRTAIIAAFTFDPSLKMVVVVDEDVDPEDPEEVEFALATRFQPDRDLVILEGMRGSSLDPSSDQATLTTSKWGLDATAPMDQRDRFRRAAVVRGG
ncbi:MAG: UbiD family decarboxylase [Nitrososphaeria archaeon]